MLAARRSLLASTAAAAASRRRSVWWSPVATARRWLATASSGDNDGADNAARLTDKKRETLGQKNAREFALLPTLLQTFEESAGHLIVPYPSVIPHADASTLTKVGNIPNWVFGRVSDMHQIPWSDDARGVNFGRVLHKFVKNPKHQKMHPQVTNALLAMGLPLGEAYRKLAWDEQIMAALRTFYQIHKHSLVSHEFVVPRGDAEWPVATWGFNLGARVNHLRWSEHELSTAELADLESVEFSFATSETRAQRKVRVITLLPQLLQTFQDATGHLIVPYRFVIPHADATIVTEETKRPTSVFGRVSDVRDIQWLETAQGVDFGRMLHSFAMNPKRQEKHPQVTSALLAMGLPLGEAYRKLTWDEQIMAALRTFYQIHKHSLVSHEFVVPRGDAEWPVATWGFNLGRRVNALRESKHQLSDSELTDLESVEFSFSVSETVWSEQVLPSIETYAQVHGNCRIPHAFEVPHEDPWPRKAWGLKLGSVVVDSIRTEVSYTSRVQRDMARLKAVRFVWEDSEYQWSEKVLPSLEVFHQVYGHSLVPCSFIVPSESPWPTEAWGLKLGVSVSIVRYRGDFAKQTERDATRLDAIGFVRASVNEHKWTDVILPSLETFAQVFGHCNVVSSFVVPSGSPWPKTAWGLRLGETVNRMRSKVYQPQMTRDANRLQAIGFAWSSRESKWTHKILPSLEIILFFQLRGHTRVPTKFVVPSESPWPEGAWGLPLGSVVWGIVHRAAYADFVDRDTDRLEAIEFTIHHEM